MLGVGRWGPGKGSQEGQVVAASRQAFLPAKWHARNCLLPMEEELGSCMLEDPLPEPCSPSLVLQEFSKEERDPVKTHEGWGVMLPCNPPAHYPGKCGPWASARLGGGVYQKGLLDASTVRTPAPSLMRRQSLQRVCPDWPVIPVYPCLLKLLPF